MKKGFTKRSLVIALCLGAFCLEINAYALDIPLKVPASSYNNYGNTYTNNSGKNYSTNNSTNYSNNYNKSTPVKTQNIKVNSTSTKVSSDSIPVSSVSTPVNNGDNYLEEVYQKYKQIVFWQKNYLLVYIPEDARADFVWSQFKVWENVLGGLITFEKVPTDKNADILVHYENAYLGRNVGFTRLSFKEGAIRRADMFIYDDILTNPLKNYAVLHEVGHALGITNHSSDPGDIMYPTKTARQNGLSMRDKNTIRLIYDVTGQAQTKYSSSTSSASNYSLRSSELQNADMLFQNGQYEPAALAYKRAAGNPQDEAEAYGGMASCYFALGNGEQAWKYAKKSVSISDSDRNLVYIFMRIGLATNHSKEVKKFLDKYIVNYPDALVDNEIQSSMILLQNNLDVKNKK